VLEQLRAVAAEAEIALLPELSLPQANSLESALAESPGDYPPLIVAGSAHVRELAEMSGRSEIRANEARVYLDGRHIGGHRKIHPFEMRRTPDGRRLEQPLLEGITKERKPITILAGEFTRLTVLICADLHDRKLPIQLEDGRVNLLLVPALTPEPGGFNGGVCGLASRCQGVSVIANVDSTFFEGAERPPFTVMVGVPRGPADEQSQEYSGPGAFPATAVVDPNDPLPEDLDWRVTAKAA
jgi:predicted amidohydrolase